MVAASKHAEVRRILGRYITEIVVAYDLCPWARTALDNGEVGIEVLFGEPTDEAWLAAARRALGAPGARVAMVTAPECGLDLPSLRAVRDRVAAALPEAGVAEFHPRAALDLATPARLVRFLRRSPDPLLQLVPLSLLDSVRVSSQPDRATQAQILLGLARPPRDVAAQIAAANHATVTGNLAEIERAFEAIEIDRAAAYARVGISCAFP